MTERENEGPSMLFVWLGVAFALVLTGAWSALTVRTGLTYHLFPLAVAVAPTTLARFLQDRPLKLGQAAFASFFALILVASAWLVLVASDRDPSATFVDGQPGGVHAEVIVLAGLGAIIGIWWAVRGGASNSEE